MRPEAADVIDGAAGNDKTHVGDSTGRWAPSAPGAELCGRIGQTEGVPRSNRPNRPRGSSRPKWTAPPELDLERARAGLPLRESAPDGEWSVRRITERNAAKTYTCPGCNSSILPGIAHLVVWREDSLFGPESALADRRHWHVRCWQTRSFRY
ncbi:hypothetical protein QFZ50_001883 [Arthrobacter agilis]|nr:hypothetical protein [Arthrobacter agilis]